MKSASFQNLHTPRLALRQLRAEDAPLYYSRLFGDARVARGMLWTPHPDPAASAERLQAILARYAAPDFYRWGIALAQTDELIGIISLERLDLHRNCCSFAYMLGVDFWGFGYAAEALRAVLCFAFDVLQLDEVAADHFADNPASGRAMQKAGMQCCGTVLKKYEKDGVWHDAVCYRITRQQFAAAMSPQ